jgi:hypothetical protein
MMLMFKIYIVELNIMYALVNYFYYMHRGSKYNVCIGAFSRIYTPILSKINSVDISPQIFEI